MPSSKTFAKRFNGDWVEISGVFLREFPVSRLREIDQSWQPARKSLYRFLRKNGQTIEHDHWNWSRKEASATMGYHRLVAIEIVGVIQGLMAIFGYPRTARNTRNAELIYVDYLESDPWNVLELPGFLWYAPIGSKLLAEAIAISEEMGFEGRIGLHSLPQSESFYQGKIGMIDGGRDGSYSDLCYFEFRSLEALAWRKTIDNT